MNSNHSNHRVARRLGQGLMLAGIAAVFAVAGIATASAQATTGSIFGKAPAGYTVSARSTTTGAGRTVHVDASGRYSAPELPVGVYKVTLKNDGKALVEHPSVNVIVGRGVQVDFDCSKLKCGETPAAE